jgi:predicted nucleic acid-binding protein
MKALITADVLVRFFVDSFNKKYTEDFEELIENISSGQIEAYITNECLSDFYSIISKKNDKELVEKIYKEVLKIVADRVISANKKLREEAHTISLKKLSHTLALVCAKANNIDVIITETPEYIQEFDFPAFSVNKALEIQRLEACFWTKNSTITQFKNQLDGAFYQEDTLQWCLFHPLEVQRKLIYKIRYSAHAVLKAFRVIQEQGSQGITIEDLSKKTGFSKETISSMSWDLYNFHLAFPQNNKIFPQPCLINMKEDEIKDYLKEILEKHAVLQAIYKKIDSSHCKAVTKWGLPELINNNCSNKKLLINGSKSSMDYTSRMLSWFFFTGLLHQKENGTLVKPDKNSQHKSYFKEKQLNLFPSIDLPKAVKHNVADKAGKSKNKKKRSVGAVNQLSLW